MSAVGVDLDAVEARAEAATEGPWRCDDSNEGTEYRPFWEVTNEAFHNPPPGDEDAPWLAVEIHTGIEADAEFIAHARADIPALVELARSQSAEIERLTREADQAIVQAEDWSATAMVMERERDEARAVLGAVAALASDWDANGNSRELGGPTADTWHKAARQLRDRLAPVSGAVEGADDVARWDQIADDWTVSAGERFRAEYARETDDAIELTATDEMAGVPVRDLFRGVADSYYTVRAPIPVAKHEQEVRADDVFRSIKTAIHEHYCGTPPSCGLKRDCDGMLGAVEYGVIRKVLRDARADALTGGNGTPEAGA